MTRTWIWLVFAIIIGAAIAAHDHQDHIDLKLIKGETRRLSRVSQQSIQNSMTHLTNSVTKVAALFERGPADLDKKWSFWQDKYEKSYQNAYDYVVMTS
jgi:hypothetical protein